MIQHLTETRRNMCIEYWHEYRRNGRVVTNEMKKHNPFKGPYRDELLLKAMKKSNLPALLLVI